MFEVLNSIVQSDIFRAVAITVLTGLFGRLFTAKGRLLWSVSHAFTYHIRNLESGNFPVLTQQILVQNFGGAALNDVEIVLNYPPQHYEIWRPRQFETKHTPDGRLAILFPTIAGHETLTINMLDTLRELPIVVDVRSSAGLGREVQMLPVIRLPAWVYGLIWLLIVIGVSALLYLATTWFLHR